MCYIGIKLLYYILDHHQICNKNCTYARTAYEYFILCTGNNLQHCIATFAIWLQIQAVHCCCCCCCAYIVVVVHTGGCGPAEEDREAGEPPALPLSQGTQVPAGGGSLSILSSFIFSKYK